MATDLAQGATHRAYITHAAVPLQVDVCMDSDRTDPDPQDWIVECYVQGSDVDIVGMLCQDSLDAILGKALSAIEAQSRDLPFKFSWER